MTTEPVQHPYIDPDPEGFGGTPHLSEYLTVVSRRLWLVLIIFTVTAASSIWAVSKRQTFYMSTLALQVNDPSDRQAGLVSIPRGLGNVSLFVDPIQSEIQVLNSSAIREQVVDSVGLRLMRADGGHRSEIMRDIWVDPEAEGGQYNLVYGSDGMSAVLMTPEGVQAAIANVGEVLDVGFFRFVLQPLPPETEPLFSLFLVPRQDAAAEIFFIAEPRIETNIVDIHLTHPDPYLTPHILNAAAVVLRDFGASAVRESARADRLFIEQRLDSAEQKLRTTQAAIRDFKTTQAFTSLSVTEQNLVNRSQRLGDEMLLQQRQFSVLNDMVNTINERGVGSVDMVAVIAELPERTNLPLRSIIDEIQTAQTEERQLVQEQRLSAGHPQVIAIRAELSALADELKEAAAASLRVVQGDIADLQATEQEILDAQARFPELEATLGELEAEQQLAVQSYQIILQSLNQIQITEAAAAPYIEILDRAHSSFPVGDSGQVNLILGALLGLILGIGAAFFLEYLDRTVRTSSDVESLLGIPVLGVIPRLRRLNPEGADQLAGRGVPLVVAMDPLDPAAEAYRNLRMNLMFMSSDEDPIRTVLFSSPGPSEGKSTSAVNYAVMLAQQGHRVLLIDADLRRPSLHRALDLLREPGLTNLLLGDAEPRETVRPNVLPNLDFLPSGPFPPNPSELLNSKAMVRVIEEMEGRYDQVVIDSPPVLAVTDAAVLAVHTDGAVVVLRSGETEQRAAERAVDQLRRLGCRVFGAVLNEVSTASPDESYYLQYYYAYTPSGSGSSSGWQRLREGMSKVRFFG